MHLLLVLGTGANNLIRQKSSGYKLIPSLLHPSYYPQVRAVDAGEQRLPDEPQAGPASLPHPEGAGVQASEADVRGRRGYDEAGVTDTCRHDG